MFKGGVSRRQDCLDEELYELCHATAIHSDETNQAIIEAMRGGCVMAIAVSEIRPVAHLPLVLGMLRKLVMFQTWREMDIRSRRSKE
jgi:hypothetical protein